MNFAEHLAATYLRLNGFMLLSNFTVFDGARHNHIDLLGLRAPNSRESVEGVDLLTDELLFEVFSNRIAEDASKQLLGVAGEVRTNDDKDMPSDGHIQYARGFLGGIPILQIGFYEGRHTVELNDNEIHIGLRYAGLWIQRRIDWMLNQKFKLTKTGSWTWSEPFLGDYLSMYQLGLLTDKRE